MSQPAAPSGLASSPVRLVRADGTTEITKTTSGLTSAAPVNDPLLVVAENIYVDSSFTGTDLPPNERQLKYHAGQIIKTSDWNSNFPDATFDAITPATGAAAGGTHVTITGSGFNPDTTVSIGGGAATSVVVINSGELTCITPAHAAGAANVVITTDAGAITETGAFTYA